jgi:hypothetical protein
MTAFDELIAERTRQEQEAGRILIQHYVRAERAGVFEYRVSQRCKRFRARCTYHRESEKFEFSMWDPEASQSIIPTVRQHASEFPTNDLLMQIELVAK